MYISNNMPGKASTNLLDCKFEYILLDTGFSHYLGEISVVIDDNTIRIYSNNPHMWFVDRCFFAYEKENFDEIIEANCSFMDGKNKWITGLEYNSDRKYIKIFSSTAQIGTLKYYDIGINCNLQ